MGLVWVCGSRLVWSGPVWILGSGLGLPVGRESPGPVVTSARLQIGRGLCLLPAGPARVAAVCRVLQADCARVCAAMSVFLRWRPVQPSGGRPVPTRPVPSRPVLLRTGLTGSGSGRPAVRVDLCVLRGDRPG